MVEGVVLGGRAVVCGAVLGRIGGEEGERRRVEAEGSAGGEVLEEFLGARARLAAQWDVQPVT